MFLVFTCSLCPRHFTCVYLFFVSHVERHVSCLPVLCAPIGKGMHLVFIYSLCPIGKDILLVFSVLFWLADVFTKYCVECRCFMHVLLCMNVTSDPHSLLQYHMITKIGTKLARYMWPKVVVLIYSWFMVISSRSWPWLTVMSSGSRAQYTVHSNVCSCCKVLTFCGAREAKRHIGVTLSSVCQYVRRSDCPSVMLCLCCATSISRVNSG